MHETKLSNTAADKAVRQVQKAVDGMCALQDMGLGIDLVQIILTCWVYIRSESQLWTVGFYDPQGKWHPDSDHESSESAAKRVHYLNGGN